MEPKGVNMNKSFRLAMAMALLTELQEAETVHGRTATALLRAKVATMVADLLA